MKKLGISLFAGVIIIMLIVASQHKPVQQSVLAGTPSVPKVAPPPSTAIQEKEAFDKQVAADKAAREAEQKKKDDAIASLDNKHPQAIENERDQMLLRALFAELTAAQAELNQKRQQANAFLAEPTAQANIKAKDLLDALKAFQKSHHAQGCDLTPPRTENKKQIGLKWDCTHAAELAAAENSGPPQKE